MEITRDGDRLTARELWRTDRMKNDITSSVHYDGFIYGIDQGILASIDAANGDFEVEGRPLRKRPDAPGVRTPRDYDRRRRGGARARDARRSPGSRGTTAVEGSTWNHPALADGFLLVRNCAQMAAFDLRPR